MRKQTRRDFVKAAGVAGAALLSPACATMPTKQVRSDEIRVAVCGVRGQGYSNAKAFMKLDGVRVVALCDPDHDVLAKRVKNFAKDHGGQKVDGHHDYREVLDRDDVHAVCIATPNHWHALMGIHAIQAGKDVYVQKPVCHTIWEGRQLSKAAAKYGKIVQAGTQNRSDVGLRPFYADLHGGALGKIKAVRGLCYRNRRSIGKSNTPVPPPPSVDYNLWLGPARDEPIYRPQFHYDWHWDWNAGNGDIGNQGPHETDLIRWALGDHSNPSHVVSFGGRFAWDDAGTTPNMQFAAYQYGDVPVFFEVRNLWVKPNVDAAPSYRGGRVSVIIDCEDGYFVGGRGGGWTYDNDGKRVQQYKGDGGGGHFANFIEAVRTRDSSILHAPVEQAHMSASLAHMANISYRVGADLSPGELRERMTDDTQALEAMDRYSAQMAEWDIDVDTAPWRAGVGLGFDPDAERFVGESTFVSQANAMLHRQDRAPFIVPKEV
jgi:predicted dehydrogenase